jgi:hypothetical protein
MVGHGKMEAAGSGYVCIRTRIIRVFLHNFVACLALACVLMFGLASQADESSGKPSNAPADQITCVDALYVGLC